MQAVCLEFVGCKAGQLPLATTACRTVTMKTPARLFVKAGAEEQVDALRLRIDFSARGACRSILEAARP